MGNISSKLHAPASLFTLQFGDSNPGLGSIQAHPFDYDVFSDQIDALDQLDHLDDDYFNK